MNWNSFLNSWPTWNPSLWIGFFFCVTEPVEKKIAKNGFPFRATIVQLNPNARRPIFGEPSARVGLLFVCLFVCLFVFSSTRKRKPTPNVDEEDVTFLLSYRNAITTARPETERGSSTPSADWPPAPKRRRLPPPRRLHSPS